MINDETGCCQVSSDPVSLNLSIISTESKCSEAKYHCWELGGVGGYSTRSSAIIHNCEITAPYIMTPGCILSLLEQILWLWEYIFVLIKNYCNSYFEKKLAIQHWRIRNNKKRRHKPLRTVFRWHQGGKTVYLCPVIKCFPGFYCFFCESVCVCGEMSSRQIVFFILFINQSLLLWHWAGSWCWISLPREEIMGLSELRGELSLTPLLVVVLLDKYRLLNILPE